MLLCANKINSYVCQIIKKLHTLAMNEDGLRLLGQLVFAAHFENVMSHIMLGVMFIWKLNYLL